MHLTSTFNQDHGSPISSKINISGYSANKHNSVYFYDPATVGALHQLPANLRVIKVPTIAQVADNQSTNVQAATLTSFNSTLLIRNHA